MRFDEFVTLSYLSPYPNRHLTLVVIYPTRHLATYSPLFLVPSPTYFSISKQKIPTKSVSTSLARRLANSQTILLAIRQTKSLAARHSETLEKPSNGPTNKPRKKLIQNCNNPSS